MEKLEICIFCNRTRCGQGMWEYPSTVDANLRKGDHKLTVCTECSMLKYPQYYRTIRKVRPTSQE